MPYAVVILPTDRVDGTPPQVSAVRELLPKHFDISAEVAAQEFVPAGSPNGQQPPSAWWLATLFSDEAFATAQQISTQFPGSLVELWNQDTEPLKPWEILADMGLQTIHEGNVP